MIPTWAIVLDYVLGTIMWTLIGRAFMNIFQREDSSFFMRVLSNIQIQLLIYSSLSHQVFYLTFYSSLCSLVFLLI